MKSIKSFYIAKLEKSYIWLKHSKFWQKRLLFNWCEILLGRILHRSFNLDWESCTLLQKHRKIAMSGKTRLWQFFLRSQTTCWSKTIEYCHQTTIKCSLYIWCQRIPLETPIWVHTLEVQKTIDTWIYLENLLGHLIDTLKDLKRFYIH